MAVQMSNDVPSTEDKIDPQFVATKFVDQYYTVLENSPKIMHKFYTEQSLVTRRGPNGEVISMKTVEEIHDEIMSSDYEGCSFDPVNIDAQASVEDGIIVAVMGNVVLKDNVRRMFHQTFFLATQPFGYFVMNDILRFSDPFESEILSSSNGNDGNASDVPPDLNQEITTLQPSEVMKVEEVSDEKGSEVKNGDDNLSEANATNIDTKEDLSQLDKLAENGSKDASELHKLAENGSKDASELGKLAENGSKDASSPLTIPSMASKEQLQDTKKISYASVVAKESKVTPPTNASVYKIVRVAPCTDKQSIAAAAVMQPTTRVPSTMANNSKKNDIASNGAAAPDNNNGHADVPGPKSIYIANLPQNVTKNALVDALKIFGPVRPGGVQIRMFEDGFCYGFVDFESAAFASKAVEAHNVTVGGNEAYVLFKKSNASKNGGRFRNGNRGQESHGNGRNGNRGQESHGNGYMHVNHDVGGGADIKSLPHESDGNGRNEESNWQSHHRGRRGNSKNGRYPRNGDRNLFNCPK